MENHLGFDKKLLDDSLVLPSWWIENFLALDKFQTHFFFQPNTTTHFKLTPSFHKRDIWFLPFFITQLQKSLFLKEKDFSLDYENSFFGSVESLSPVKKTSLLRFLHSVGSMKVLVDHSEGMFALPLFKNEARNLKESSCVLKFKFSFPHIEELFLGYKNPYSFLLEEKKISFSSSLLLKNPPFMIKKSLWFDLTSTEQFLWWNFKKKNGLSKSLVGVENEGEIDFSELFQGVFLRTSEDKSCFIKKLKIAKKFFEKLRCHGELETVTDQFFALGKGDGALKFVFKASKNSSEDLHSYQLLVNSYYFYKNIELLKSGILHERIRLFLEGSYDGALEPKLKEALAIIEKDPQASTRMICLPHGGFLSLPLLFLEYLIRAKEQGVKKIPEDVRSLSCMLFLDKTSFSENDYHNFIEYFSHEEFCLEILSSVPFATFLGSSPMNIALQKFSNQSNELVASSIGSPDKTHVLPMVEKQEISRTSIMDGIRKIKKSSLDQYRILTDNYVSSLDENSRYLLLSVKKKMQPNMFEEHLDRRLIDYVIANPKKFGSLVSPSLNLN